MKNQRKRGEKMLKVKAYPSLEHLNHAIKRAKSGSLKEQKKKFARLSQRMGFKI